MSVQRSGLLAAAALWIALATPANALELRFSSENDVLVHNPTNDDLYTFAFAFELQRGPYLFSLRENAFTDRQAAVRFDETYGSVWVPVDRLLPWNVHVEGGIVHVGHGLFGQEVQNSFHHLINASRIHIPYYRSSLHPSLGMEAERLFRPAERFGVGPRFEAQSVPGLRSHAVAAAQALWQPRPEVAIRVLGGGRVTHASLAPLEPHLETFAPIARVGVVLYDRLFMSWTYNDYGDRREHVSLGYWTALGERGRDSRPSPGPGP